MPPRLPPIFVKCTWCGLDMSIDGDKATYYRKCGRAFCKEECQTSWMSDLSSRTMAATNRKYASQRMKERNPMRFAKVRQIVTKKARERGWPEGVERGGNGRGPSAPQKILSEALGWPMEVGVLTLAGRKRGGLPALYKIDIANREAMIAIEVDGPGHSGRLAKARDAKKSAFLTGLGWKVLRFTNRQVVADLKGCVQTVLSTTSK